MRFVFEQILVGGDRNFGYLIGDREVKEAVAVDPSYSPEKIVQRAEAQDLEIKMIINTHSHFDHTNGNDQMQKMTGAQIMQFNDNDVVEIGKTTLQIISVPGHTPDHIVVFLPKEKVALTGDHLFVGKIGGTSGEKQALKQYESFQKMFTILPEETTIWPGHHYGCRPSSTMALEKTTNPFFLAKDFQEFFELKANWSSFKKQYGLM